MFSFFCLFFVGNWWYVVNITDTFSVFFGVSSKKKIIKHVLNYYEESIEINKVNTMNILKLGCVVHVSVSCRIFISIYLKIK